MNPKLLFRSHTAVAALAALAFCTPPASAQDKPAPQPAAEAKESGLQEQINRLQAELKKVSDQTAAEIEAMRKKIDQLAAEGGSPASGNTLAGQVPSPPLTANAARPVFKRIDNDSEAPIVIEMKARAATEPAAVGDAQHPPAITFKRLDDEAVSSTSSAAEPPAQAAAEPVQAEPFANPKSFTSTASKIAFAYDPAAGSWSSKPDAVQGFNGEKFVTDAEKELKADKHIPADAVLTIQPDRSILIESESLKPKKAISGEAKAADEKKDPAAKAN